ncbi:hypothetical protein GALMADRAFT_255578 [Galerina marginata CBS 339.88]|uniref:Secreted protein n=1 Tax=Galerina marginata (strain CBS 339.88) TaxID=685588 RepID=A0A067SFV9_GALM3|nr:hypothetical protein GALMADRAFT_255578 [Galerina marginata CBS 339.88]
MFLWKATLWGVSASFLVGFLQRQSLYTGCVAETAFGRDNYQSVTRDRLPKWATSTNKQDRNKGTRSRVRL